MELNEQSVAAYHELMTNPTEHGLPIRPLKECFEPSEEVTAQHILFRDYIKESPACPKIFFYIVMEMVYGRVHLKDADGNLGFPLKFIEPRELDWTIPKSHFDGVRKTYEEFDAIPGVIVNTKAALELVFKPLAERYENGERSEELYDAMMAVE